MRIETCKPLIEAGLVSSGAIEEAIRKSRTNNRPMLVNLFENCDVATQSSISKMLAQFYRLPLLHLDKIIPSSNLLRLCKLEEVRRYYFLPIIEKDSSVVVGMIDPIFSNNIDVLQHIFQKPIKPAFIFAHDFENALHRFFRNQVTSPIVNKKIIDTARLKQIMRGNSDGTISEPSLETIAAKYIRHVISSALTYGASDIQIAPSKNCLLVTLRIEGSKRKFSRLSISHYSRILSAFKKLVKMDKNNTAINQRRTISLRFGGRAYKLLVHFRTIPAGESVTVRIIDLRFVGLSLHQLGFSSETESIIKTSLDDLGLILVTGPRGSGKSSVIKSFLRHLADGKRRIISLEDEIIETFPGIKQVQSSLDGPEKSHILRSLLHNTPNVIAIDEVSDEETIAMALQLATSEDCLVIIAMEANGTAEAITHMLSKGADRTQLANTLRLAFTQKAIRKTCANCKRSFSPHPDTMQRLQIPQTLSFFAGKGCDTCKQTGYSGKVIIEEHLHFTPKLSDLLKDGASGKEIYTQARYDGMLTLSEAAINKAIDGKTALNEVLGIFAFPSDFNLKNRLHLGRINHLNDPNKSDKMNSDNHELTTMFKVAAKEKSEPFDLDNMAGFQNTKIVKQEEKTQRHHASSTASPLDDIKLDLIPKEASTQGADERNDQADQQSEKLMVLLLDDSAVMLEYTRHILSDSGYFVVHTADTVAEAWNMLQNQYFHLVITDHEMPEQTGQNFIKQMRHNSSLNKTGTILLTGNINEASALTEGADGYIAKPTDPELLVARARSIGEIYKRMSSDSESMDKTKTTKSLSNIEKSFDSADQKDIYRSSMELDSDQIQIAKT